MRSISVTWGAVALVIISVISQAGVARAGEGGLERLAYNNPGLVVDLGVGLWAWPLPMDFNGDGLPDLVVACPDKPYNGIYFFENTGRLDAARQPIFKQPRYFQQEARDVKFGALVTPVGCDWDGDGLPDLIVNSILGKVHWYRNTGTRQAPALAPAQPIEVEWEGAQPSLAWGWMRPEGKKLLTQWRTTPVAVDWNKDGLVDLVMLDHEGYLAFFERAEQGDGRILKHPRRIFRDTKGAPLQFNKGRAGRSGRRKLCVVDWDGDGRLDLLLNSRNAEFWRQVRAEDGRYYFENKGHLHDRNVEGHDVSPTFVDFNNDGIPDFVGGAEDGHLYYLRNPRTP